MVPNCGIRSSSPTMTASTSGNGRPKAKAERPATTPATIEIMTLPSNVAATAEVDRSRIGLQRASVCGRMNPKSQSVIRGRSISRNSETNVSVTTDSSEENALPAKPRTALAVPGSSLASVDRSESTDRSLRCDSSGFRVGLRASSFQ